MNLNTNTSRFQGKKIVVVEDDLPSIRYYETLLKNSGADVQMLKTGEEFIEYFNSNNGSADLIIMDFLIPIINGIECIRTFRKKFKDIPVIMITAYSSEQTKTSAYVAGCNEFILKPIYPEKIFFLLEKYLKTEISVTI